MKRDDKVIFEGLTLGDMRLAKVAIEAKASRTRALIVAKGAALPETPGSRTLRDTRLIVGKLERKAAACDEAAHRFGKAIDAVIGKGE